ncbi:MULTISPECIES: hypothetical protein [Brevibacterium]|uniref:Uncharacterized protein n=2 Tax=Brevibacterium antiquum TaxID=234835 RepID=A0A2H1IVA5_9MICO|nr:MULTISPECIES: hypothetical protein [Brevibacterium]SMX75112.1 hypothetical protein BANT10_00944 [Brevibacterium antiquum]SMX79115.1 hypothetical protein BANT918_01109 [Brevibacterium antiquum CNRZ 918]HCG56154.1 hypothetical protein [Brevibacterium sp.]
MMPFWRTSGLRHFSEGGAGGRASGMIFDEPFSSLLISTLSTILVWATAGISFPFRPLGTFPAGHYGDRLGHRVRRPRHIYREPSY